MWFEQMHPEWQSLLGGWRDWLERTQNQLANQTGLVPDTEKVMTAFELAPSRIRVIVLGQDPYPTPGVAVGRAFAVASDHPALPASLRNIFTELQSDQNQTKVPTATLESWQDQGVWLLNRHLTTLESAPGSHFGIGWQDFTLAAIQQLILNSHQSLVFLLWGNQARAILPSVQKYIDENPARLLILESPHPSPLSAYRGFFGSKPFGKVNEFFSSRGEQTIDWFN